MSKHWKIGPSSMARVMECPGSIELCDSLAQVEDDGSSYAREGTEAHACLEALFNNGSLEEFSQEMMDHAQWFLDNVWTVGELHGKLIACACEESIQDPHIADFGGTPDLVLRYDDNGRKVLIVADYKYGKGVKVHARDNKQLLAYATLLSAVGDVTYDVIILVIGQPRLKHFEAWVVSPQQVQDFRVDLVNTLEAEDKPLKRGDHCRWCKAFAKCPAVWGTVKEVLESPESMEMNEKLAVLPLLRQFIREIPVAAKEMMERGETVKGYKLVQALGNRSYSDADAVIERLKAKRVPKKVYMPPSLVSPTKLKELGYDKIVSDLIVRKSKGLIAVPESDSRPAEAASLLTEIKSDE